MPMSRPASYTEKLYFTLQREQSTQALALSNGASGCLSVKLIGAESLIYPALKSLRQSKDIETVPLRCSAYSYENQLIQLCGVLGQETKYPPPVSYQYDVFLGGACNPTTWRRTYAIPFLTQCGISFYNPQVDEWNEELVELEDNAKRTSRVLLFVFETWRTRGISSFVEVAYLTALTSNLVLVISDVTGLRPPVIGGEQISEAEFACLERAINYLRILATFRGVPVFSDISEGLNHVKKMIIDCRLEERRKTELPPISAYELILVNKITSICDVFKSLPKHSPGYVTVEQVRALFCEYFPLYWPYNL
ncbi:hypothetical protein AHF37_08684 [Paragonimus kellicotti]|nr:hypothetical protein AHF37_08684 [Paragonimus kellicotti]